MHGSSRRIAVAAIALAAAAGCRGGEPEGNGLRVEPAYAVVPANHLKFYLHFPEPMERGEVFRHLRLVEIDGEGNEAGEVPEPFREVELWDETFTRLTLWFHPGRQKPGVNLNVDIGPILEEGKRYRLEVSPRWRMESGEPLSGRLAHEFRAGPMDDEQPDPDTWTFAKRNEKEVYVATGEPLDPASLRKRACVLDAEGNELLQVEILPAPDGFTLAKPSWLAGRYRLRIDPQLEDLAGNSVARPFNLDVEASPGFVERTEPVEIEFFME